MTRLLYRPVLAGITSALALLATPASASYLFWTPPNFAGAPVRGDEPGLGLPIPGATPKEIGAHLLWNMRAGLNVAALQCQFAPALATVKNYNTILSQHGTELASAYETISGYFKRTSPKGTPWQSAFDQYTTRTYNGFSTLYAQLGFCDTAAAIGRDALDRPRGTLHQTAEARMREFRNSLVPIGDPFFVLPRPQFVEQVLPPLDPKCWNKRDELTKRCQETWDAVVAAGPRPLLYASGATTTGS